MAGLYLAFLLKLLINIREVHHYFLKIALVTQVLLDQLFVVHFIAALVITDGHSVIVWPGLQPVADFALELPD